jgi:hypothetical protein
MSMPVRHLVLAPFVALSACAAPEPPLELWEVEAGVLLSAQLADRFQERLLERLQAAIAAEGIVAAIHVCAEQAPAMARALAAESGASVRRTALRHRNPSARPDAYEARVLESWAQAPVDATGRPKRQHAVSRDGLEERLLFLRAIPTGPQCLACHGEADAIAPEVREAISARYPDDMATGFAAGDLRGAFSIGWDARALRRAIARTGASHGLASAGLDNGGGS